MKFSKCCWAIRVVGTRIATCFPSSPRRRRRASRPIEFLSRFQNKREQDQIATGLKTGAVDIVIGTHKLLQEEVSFKRLGLLVIDEEHRFGVRQKERLKMMRAEVDIVTLTATPIPRTLNLGNPITVTSRTSGLLHFMSYKRKGTSLSLFTHFFDGTSLSQLSYSSS